MEILAISFPGHEISLFSEEMVLSLPLMGQLLQTLFTLIPLGTSESEHRIRGRSWI